MQFDIQRRSGEHLWARAARFYYAREEVIYEKTDGSQSEFN